MGTVASIARNLGARRQGSDWCCTCPRECGYEMLLAQGEDGRLLAYCRGGCDFDEIRTALVDFGLLDGDEFELPYEAPAVRERTIEDQKLRIEGARWIYIQSTDAVQTVHTYLRSRGITLSSPVLCFCPNAPHRLGTRLPAMVAPIVDIDGQQIGTHLTYLRADGRGKANFANREFQRETRGETRGGVIRLAEHDPDCELVIGEGIETTLAAMQMFVLPGWAAVYAGNLKDRLELPETVRRILIAADNDIAGINAAHGARRRWTAQGRSVRVVMPSCVDTDFNDVLLRGTR